METILKKIGRFFNKISNKKVQVKPKKKMQVIHEMQKNLKNERTSN